jgi:hypothetical protein
MPHASRWIRAVALGGLIPAALALSLAACAAPGTDPLAPTSASPSTSPGAQTTSAPPGPATTSPAPPPPPSGAALSRVTVIRSGGIAGVMQSLQIEADGSWTYVDRRSGDPKTGRLTSTQRQQLAGLLRSAAFSREARMPPPVGVCNDGFVYSIQMGGLSARLDDCGTAGQRPTLEAVVDLLVTATEL